MGIHERNARLRSLNLRCAIPRQSGTESSDHLDEHKPFHPFQINRLSYIQFSVLKSFRLHFKETVPMKFCLGNFNIFFLRTLIQQVFNTHSRTNFVVLSIFRLKRIINKNVSFIYLLKGKEVQKDVMGNSEIQL